VRGKGRPKATIVGPFLRQGNNSKDGCQSNDHGQINLQAGRRFWVGDQGVAGRQQKNRPDDKGERGGARYVTLGPKSLIKSSEDAGPQAALLRPPSWGEGGKLG